MQNRTKKLLASYICYGCVGLFITCDYINKTHAYMAYSKRRFVFGFLACLFSELDMRSSALMLYWFAFKTILLTFILIFLFADLFA